jgi:RNA polymerase sigma factor (sigma-70 family)
MPRVKKTETPVSVTKAKITERPGYREANEELAIKYAQVKSDLALAREKKNTKLIASLTVELNKIAEDFYIKNKALAVSMAKPFLNPGDPNAEDYINSAGLGLWEAFQRWDPTMGVTFGTFSRHFIKGRVMRSVRASEYSHISQTDFNRRKEVRDTFERLSESLGRTPTRAELSAELQLNVNAINRALAPATSSIDVTLGDGSTTFSDILGEAVDFYEKYLIESEANSGLDYLLDELNDLELWVINARSGNLGTPDQSLVEVADQIGVGREIARRTEAKAKARLLYTVMSHEENRLPSWEEFATKLNIHENINTKDGKTLTPAIQAENLLATSWSDLHERWVRASKALMLSNLKIENTSYKERRSRLDRIGEEIIRHGAKLISEHAVSLLNEEGKVIGEEEASLEFWQCFTSWKPEIDSSFPAHFKNKMSGKYRKTTSKKYRSDLREVLDGYQNFWARIKRREIDILK